MKKIVLFGATGGTGFQVTKQLLDAGHIVTAVVRNPSAFQLKDKNLILVKGDVTQPNSISDAMEDNDVVISVLGTGTNLKPTQVYSVGIKNIISEMQKHNIKRLLCVSAGGLIVNPTMNVIMRFAVKNILQRILKEVYADMRIMESTVQATNLDYSIIRPHRLTNKSFQNKYRSAINIPLNKASSIGRSDLANAIIKLIDNKHAYKSIIEIAY